MYFFLLRLKLYVCVCVIYNRKINTLFHRPKKSIIWAHRRVIVAAGTFSAAKALNFFLNGRARNCRVDEFVRARDRFSGTCICFYWQCFCVVFFLLATHKWQYMQIYELKCSNTKNVYRFVSKDFCASASHFAAQAFLRSGYMKYFYLWCNYHHQISLFFAAMRSARKI